MFYVKQNIINIGLKSILFTLITPLHKISLSTHIVSLKKRKRKKKKKEEKMNSNCVLFASKVNGNPQISIFTSLNCA